MPKGRNVKRILECVGIAAILALAAGASSQAAEPNGGGAKPAEETPTVTLPGSTVLPNAPKVGDTPGTTAPTVAPLAPHVGETALPTEAGEDATPVSPDDVKGSPDWPCVQRKVATISPAQVWDGPPIDDVKGWENDEKIADLTTYLQSRRVPLEKAEKAIKDYAASVPEAERDKKLTELFASVFKKLNSDRTFVIGRVEQFQRRQKARAGELEREGSKLADLNQSIPADEEAGPRDAALTPEQQEYNWNARIFQERQQNLTVACEIPILIEQRAYEIAKQIRAEMSN
jgi:hypothetical protein